jgi:hypothetical protein
MVYLEPYNLQTRLEMIFFFLFEKKVSHIIQIWNHKINKPWVFNANNTKVVPYPF